MKKSPIEELLESLLLLEQAMSRLLVQDKAENLFNKALLLAYEAIQNQVKGTLPLEELVGNIRTYLQVEEEVAEYRKRKRQEQKEEALRNVAFLSGVTVDDYLALKARIGAVRFRRLREIMHQHEKNKHHVKKCMQDGLFFQLSILELYDFFVEEGKKRDIQDPLTAIDMLTSKNSSLCVARKDWTKPFSKDNITLITKEEFGRILGTNHVPYRSSTNTR
jgi:hypothetical protein